MDSNEIAGEPRARGLAASPDLWVIAAWFVFAAAGGFLRRDFTGDGVRHLGAIASGAGLHLGEPRWLLFPGLLYLLMRPFVVLGLAPTVESLTRVMMGATLLAATAYMLALRACLVAARVDVRRRAAALALAGLSAAFFVASTDLMEPIYGASLIVCTLAWAARRVARVGSTAAEHRRALLVTVAAIALAALTYQGLVLAVGLLPLVFPREVLRDRRALVLSLAILACVPIVMIGGLVLAGNSVPHALKRALQGEENGLYRNFLKHSGPLSRVLPLVGGPPQGIVNLQDFRGFNGLLAGLRGGPGRSEALWTLARFALGGGIVLAGLLAALRRKDRGLLIAFAVMMILPLVRYQQYGYIKFYIFMAVLVAYGAARARPAVVAVLAVVLLSLSVKPMLSSVPEELAVYHEHEALYAQVGPRSCWVTPAWVPPHFFLWPGRICGVLATLASGHGETEDDVVAAAHAATTTCLEACFCDSSAVFTDDMTEASSENLAISARQFQYTVFDLGELVLPTARAERVSPAGASKPVLRYPVADQRRICERLTRARATAP
jgi:hypothetical protein